MFKRGVIMRSEQDKDVFGNVKPKGKGNEIKRDILGKIINDESKEVKRDAYGQAITPKSENEVKKPTKEPKRDVRGNVIHESNQENEED